MIISTNQPYFAPYPGFFYKAQISDYFVILDDVQFPRKTTWITRNRFKNDQGTLWMTIPVRKKGYYLFRDFELLLWIPKPDRSNGFFISDITAADLQYSVLNTVDFQRRRRPFDRYGCAMGKIMEHVHDLAIMHSCISDPVDRAAVKQRYENYLDIKFRDRLAVLIVKLQNCDSYDRRSTLKNKISELNRRILEPERHGRGLRPLKAGTVES